MGQSTSTELAVRWLRKADNDLITARQTLLLADGPTDTVAFHVADAVVRKLGEKILQMP